jgi:DNA-binding NarL/FixJ family response regulator
MTTAEPTDDSTRTTPPADAAPRLTILVAHADDAERALLTGWLGDDDRLDLVADTEDTGSTVAAVIELVPQIVFVDLALVEGRDPTRSHAVSPTDGVGTIAAIRAAAPAVRVIAVSPDDDDRAYSALAAGAIGCHLWADVDDQSKAVTDLAAGVGRGEGALTTGWAGRLLDEVRWLAREPGPVPAPELTPTELEVVRRISTGASPAAIGELHGVTVHLVNIHAGAAITKVWRHHDDDRQVARLRAR